MKGAPKVVRLEPRTDTQGLKPTRVALLLVVCLLGMFVMLSWEHLMAMTEGPGEYWAPGEVAHHDVYARSKTVVRLGPDQDVTILAGQVVVRRGDVITRQEALILEQLAKNTPGTRLRSITGHALIVLLLGVILVVFLLGLQDRTLAEPGHLVLLTLLVLGPVLAHRSLMSTVGHESLFIFNAIPVTVVLAAIFLGGQVALILDVLLSILLGVIAAREAFLLATYAVVAGLVGQFCVSKQFSDRRHVVKAGLAISLVNIITLVAFNLVFTLPGAEASFDVVFSRWWMGFANGLMSMVVVLGLVPVLESFFGVSSSAKLQEILNPTHPLLQKVIREAPGTYHHSVNVAHLAEAAAREVGADPILAKAASYYHDLGKTKRPYFFIENQVPGVNYHDNLSPHLSRLIIHSHTRDGVEIAKPYNLPKGITDVMLQHHGTDVVAFFYHRARDSQAENDPEVVRDDFRYAGPKPQTREAAIVMICDAVEAASRTLRKPTSTNIEALVTKIINDRFNDQQFDESNLTRRDMDLIKERVSKTLLHMFHNRISYPEGVQPSEFETEDDNGPADSGSGTHSQPAA